MNRQSAQKEVETKSGQSAITGYVSEIFCSIQGEGLYVGQRQVFFRTAGCSATCYWCDTVAAKEEQRTCTIHGDTRHTLSNPLSFEQAFGQLIDLHRQTVPAAVSVTGGEPLEQADFVTEIARGLHKRKIPVYLETSGLEVEGLIKIRPYVDVVAMDIKLPHATGRDHWETHRDFLKWLVGRNSFVKIVVDATTPFEEIEAAVHLIAETDRGFPLVLQPESGTYLKNKMGAEGREALVGLLDRAQRLALESLLDVRVTPQCHKIMRVR